MAEPWIRVHAALIEKPVVGRLSDALGISLHEATGLLVTFWGAVSRHAQRGHVGDHTDKQLEAWARWQGKRGRFAMWLRAAHLDADGRINEWEDYAGALEQQRERDRIRIARFRERNANSNGDVTRTERVQNANGTHDVTRTVGVTSPLRNPVTIRDDTKDQELTTSRSRKKPRDAGPGKPVENWVATFGDWWNAHVGAVSHGQVGRVLKPAFATHGLEKLLAGAAVYNDPLEGPPRRSFADFAASCALWVELAAMLPFDANGNETLRTKRLATRKGGA